MIPLACHLLTNLARLGAVCLRAEGQSTILSRCANDQCGKPFLRLRDKKLFLVETERLTNPGSRWHRHLLVHDNRSAT